jgi:DNA-binding transcriptional MerR regulator
LGCHRPRISDRIVFDKLLQLLRFGCSYEAIADSICSASTIRNRRDNVSGPVARTRAFPPAGMSPHAHTLLHMSVCTSLRSEAIVRRNEMRIGELAERTGVSARLLRYYEAQGLLRADRDGNGYRFYGESAVERVLLIRELLESGFTTELIRSSLPCRNNPPGPGEPPPCATPQTVDSLRRQVRNIERRLESLGRTHAALRSYLSAAETELEEAAPGDVTATAS